MRSILFCFILFLGHSFSQSQLKANAVDLGQIPVNGERHADIVIENKNSTPVYILRIKHSPFITKRFDSDKIPANSSLLVRVQYNPKQKGKFNETIEVFTSDLQAPLRFQLKGEILSMPEGNSYLIECPEFGVQNDRFAAKPITIITVDKATQETLSKTKVVVIHNGTLAGAWETGRKGNFQVMIPSGYFYFLATHEGYLKKEDGIYVPPGITEITIPLVKDQQFVPPSIPVEVVTTDTAMIIPVAETITIIEETAKIDSTSAPILIPELSTLDPNNFDPNYFKNLNVVFVLDVSASMKQYDRINLMKFSLNELVKKLRNEDFMGVVTYSDRAKVFQQSVNGNQKDILLGAVSKIEPSGLTAGGKGIKLGYKQVMKSYDPNKLNMVIIITDGAFNKDSDDYQKVVKKYAQKGVQFSVVGIKANVRDAGKMKEASDFGKGVYVGINELSDAQSQLYLALRQASFKR